MTTDMQTEKSSQTGGAVATQDLYFSAADGLKLHAREWCMNGLVAAGVPPLVCLPGLARTAEDFDKVARAVAAGHGCKPRRVVALDYRGRGLSEWDRDWRNYDIRIENQDILTVLTAMGIDEAVCLGTSRGGLHLMVLAATRPALLQRVILNDIGPVLESKGLARIRGYVGKLPAPRNWDDAVDMCKHLMSAQFTGLDDAGWLAYARLTFQELDGVFKPRYDTKLMKVLEALDLSVSLPKLWPQFGGLAHAPMLVLRGENSDLLSSATLDAMAQAHPACQTYVVPGQGHAPLLLDETSIAKITAFVAEGD